MTCWGTVGWVRAPAVAQWAPGRGNTGREETETCPSPGLWCKWGQAFMNIRMYHWGMTHTMGWFRASSRHLPAQAEKRGRAEASCGGLVFLAKTHILSTWAKLREKRAEGYRAKLRLPCSAAVCISCVRDLAQKLGTMLLDNSWELLLLEYPSAVLHMEAQP